jgi:hypothetical protein
MHLHIFDFCTTSVVFQMATNPNSALANTVQSSLGIKVNTDYVAQPVAILLCPDNIFRAVCPTAPPPSFAIQPTSPDNPLIVIGGAICAAILAIAAAYVCWKRVELKRQEELELANALKNQY